MESESMSDAVSKAKRTRSPNFPALSLSEACERVQPVWEKAQRHDVPLSALANMWDMSATSSTVAMNVAALKHYGLMEDVETRSNERHFRLTSLALQIINHSSGSPERMGALARSVLLPALNSEIWGKYQGRLPDDSIIKPYLLNERGFNRESVDRFLNKFRDSIAFSNLLPPSESDQATRVETSSPPAPIEAVREQFQNGLPDVAAVNRDQARQPRPVKTLSIPLEDGREVNVPYPMTDDDFDLMISTLDLWKKRIVKA